MINLSPVVQWIKLLRFVETAMTLCVFMSQFSSIQYSIQTRESILLRGRIFLISL